jgi:prolyl-tRNA editing enzyme YbaK/EbsC (Cys-tRNA(Pro) deacylase)
MLDAASGHPHAVFKLTPRQLHQLTGAPVADVVDTVATSPS